MKTRRINIFGGPGVGKSVSAAKIYGELSGKNMRVELVRECAKDWAYESRKITQYEYMLVFGKQLYAEFLPLDSGVDVIVTDSPLMLQAFYAHEHGFSGWKEIAECSRRFERDYPSLNIVLTREQTAEEYDPVGRNENYYQAVEVDKCLRGFLYNRGVGGVVVAATGSYAIEFALRTVIREYAHE